MAKQQAKREYAAAKTRLKTYLRKRDVARRYGDVTLRTIERGVERGDIPPPEFPCGPNVPMWDLDVLEAAERAAVIRGGNPNSSEKPE